MPKTISEKRAIFEANLDSWRKMSPEQQLADLDRRLGKDKGATKQRAKLHAKIAAAAAPKPERKFASNAEKRRAEKFNESAA